MNTAPIIMNINHKSGLMNAKSLGMGRIELSTIPIPIPMKNNPV